MVVLEPPERGNWHAPFGQIGPAQSRLLAYLNKGNPHTSRTDIRTLMTRFQRTALNPCATLVIDHADPAPVYAQLMTQLRAKIFNGEIAKGERLPASRPLAYSRGVARRTIVTAFEELGAEGLLETRHGDGTYCVFDEKVSARTGGPGPSLDLAQDQTQDSLEKDHAVLPFSRKGIDPGALSIKAWSAAAARAQRKLSTSHLFGSLPGGLPRLKEALTKHILALRGISVDPSQVIITAGIRESIDLVTEMLPSLRCVAGEEPSNERIRKVIERSGEIRPLYLPLAVDQDGAGFGALETAQPVDAVLITPSHQYPMGITLSHERRLDLLARLGDSDTWIFEDDYGAAVRYSGANIQPIFELDSRKRTIYFGSLSTILFSNLHLSFLVVPKDKVGPIVRIQEKKGSLASILAQGALAEFMECGAFAQHLLELRRCSQINYTFLIDEVRAKLNEWLEPVPIDGGGSFAALARDPAMDDKAIARAAWAAGIDPAALSPMYFDPAASKPGLVFGFMGTSPEQSRVAVDRLRTILSGGSS